MTAGPQKKAARLLLLLTAISMLACAPDQLPQKLTAVPLAPPIALAACAP